jgi:predicted dehydrogenase
MWQGPAPRHAYQVGRQRSWRSYYAYGGGLVTDWGVHHIDVVHWFLSVRAPLLTSASAQYVTVQNPERDQVPDSFICSWQYDKFVMSFANAPVSERETGNYFYGTRGVLHLNRFGYSVRPAPSRRRGEQDITPRDFEEKDGMNRDSGTLLHTRNFLYCIKSRNSPMCDIETGFYSTLPTLIALLAIQQGRSFAWRDGAAQPV